nr:polysaccharide deacetylase family protein [Paenibacillus sp. CAA11]
MNRKKAAAITAGLVTAMLAGYFGDVQAYIDTVNWKTETASQPVFFMQSEDPVKDDALMSRIRQEAEGLRIEPIDAVVDRVWKAIPGYSGREVDVEETYRRITEGGTAPYSADKPIPFVFREIKPKVSLNDLEAQPIYRGNKAKPMAALMINVAWGNEYLPSILNTLDEEKVKATFFLDGSWLSKNVELAKEIQRRGHQLENHAYSHPNMSQVSSERARLEITKTKKLLSEKLGVTNRWFAPPSGDFDARTVKIAAEEGLKTVLWTVDTVDWRNPSPDSVIAKISKQAEAGSLILMHPTASTQGSIKGIIRVLKSKGYTVGTVEETLSENRVTDAGS